MSINVFKQNFTWRPRYYLKHPIKFFADLRDSFRAMWMRATKGYCYSDVWNMNTWMLEIFPPMLRHMAEYGCAYPGDNEFDIPEKWNDYLNSLADIFELLQEENWLNKNEYEDKYFHAVDMFYDRHPNLTTTTTLTQKDIDTLHDKWIKRVEELNKERQETINDVFKSLARIFDALWD